MRTQSLTLQALDKENDISSHSMLEISMYKFNLFIPYLIYFFVLFFFHVFEFKNIVNIFNDIGVGIDYREI